MNFIYEAIEETESLQAAGGPRPGDTWQLNHNGYCSWAVIKVEERVLLVPTSWNASIGPMDVEQPACTYKGVKMPRTVLHLDRGEWLDLAVVEAGMRDGFITPFLLKRVKESL